MRQRWVGSVARLVVVPSSLPSVCLHVNIGVAIEICSAVCGLKHTAH